MTEGPVTRGRRFFKLAGMTAQVAGSYATTRIKSIFQSEENAETDLKAAHERNGGRIAKTLGELKGAVMKVGQMASIASDILPKELAEALRGLQRQAPPVDYEVIAGQIERELGSPPENLFKFFDRKPFASASIGQVHRATTDDGREVVVKVQYPGVDTAVSSDLSQLKMVLKASGLIKVRKQALDEVFREVKARLAEELDYCNEADNVRKFREFHARHPFVVIPDVVGERSAQRVLTLTYEAGDHISELAPLGYDQATRDLLGQNLFKLLVDELFEFRNLHADPNPGNLAFRRDGSVVLYDFGCVKQIPDAIIEAYGQTIRCGLEEDYAGVEAGLRALGVLNPDGPPVELEYYKPWRDIFALPFLADDIFDYGRSTIHDDVIKQVPGALKRLESFQPPSELVFIDRAIAGHYGNLRKIGARGRFLAMLRPYIYPEPA